MERVFYKWGAVTFSRNEVPGSHEVRVENKDQLHRFIDTWLKQGGREDIVLSGYDEARLKTDFQAFFYFLEAAGGVVFNKKDQVLFIYRAGIWDLPKGKLDKNEEIAHCALREVEEETGVGQLRITENLKASFHIYWHKDQWYLKKTHWFFMETDSDQALVPQLEEEITEARWMDLKECRDALDKTFRSLRDSIGREICDHFKKLHLKS